MKARTLFVVVLLAFGACVPSATVPVEQPVRPYYAQPLIPEEWYAKVYDDVVACWGDLLPDDVVPFAALEFFLVPADGLVSYGSDAFTIAAGQWSWRRHVYLDTRFVMSELVLKHEISHAVMLKGDELHEHPKFKECVEGQP